jgi:hypothetical protein
MKRRFALIALIVWCSAPVLANKKQSAKATLTTIIKSLASRDGYSYQIQSETEVQKKEGTPSEQELIRVHSLYYFSRENNISYLHSKERVYLSCHQGVFNCDEQQRVVSYSLAHVDSATGKLQALVPAYKVKQLDSMFLQDAVVKLLKNKGALISYQVAYPKSAFGDQVVVVYNSKLRQLHALDYTIIQQLQTGLLVKHKIHVSQYENQVPSSLRVLLNDIASVGDLKTYLEKHFEGYNLVNTKGH